MNPSTALHLAVVHRDYLDKPRKHPYQLKDTALPGDRKSKMRHAYDISPVPPQEDEHTPGARKVGYNAGLSRRRSRVRAPSAPPENRIEVAPSRAPIEPAGAASRLEIDWHAAAGGDSANNRCPLPGRFQRCQKKSIRAERAVRFALLAAHVESPAGRRDHRTGQSDSVVADRGSHRSTSRHLTGALASEGGPHPLGADQMGLDLQTPTVGDLARAWLDSVQQCVDVGTRSAHTFTAYEKAARLGIGKWFADVAADSVRPVQVQKMANAIRDERGPAIANQCVYAIRQAYAFASNSDLWVGACPAANIRKFAQKHRRHPLEADAGGRVAAYLWEAFLRSSSRHVVTEVQAAYFLTLLGTGLRRSEVSHLHRAEWDRVSQRITITEHKCSRTRGPKVVEGVGAAVVLDAVVERDWHGHWFFPSARAKRGHIENPERAWHRLRKAADVPEETRIHDIRHGFIASAFAQCGDLKQCQTLVQHSSIATTSRYVGDAPRSLISPLAKSAAAGLMGGGR